MFCFNMDVNTAFVLICFTASTCSSSSKVSFDCHECTPEMALNTNDNTTSVETIPDCIFSETVFGKNASKCSKNSACVKGSMSKLLFECNFAIRSYE